MIQFKLIWCGKIWCSSKVMFGLGSCWNIRGVFEEFLWVFLDVGLRWMNHRDNSKSAHRNHKNRNQNQKKTAINPHFPIVKCIAGRNWSWPSKYRFLHVLISPFFIAWFAICHKINKNWSHHTQNNHIIANRN